jgi:hypothetical protein
MRKLSAKARLKLFFLENIGIVVSSTQLKGVVETSEWARRVREIKAEEGWPILTNNDSAALKPGQYLLAGNPPAPSQVTFKRGISAKLRAQVLDRNGFTCQMCGLTPGEIDPATNRKVRLHIGHIKDKSLGGKEELSNLRALCSTCNQGAKNVTAEKPSTIWLLSQIRKAGFDEQQAVLKFLQKKFEPRESKI